jgi:DNA repair protein SbcD/Mre11
MKILHTADWHLGFRLKRVDRMGDLRRNVERVMEYCASESVDVLLIAGDLFDNVSRSDDVCAAIDHLKGAVRPFLLGGGTILATTGNHDGETLCKTLQHALELAAPTEVRPGDVIAPGRFHLATRSTFFRVKDRAGPDVQFMLMPYPTPARYLDDSITRYEVGEQKNRLLREKFTELLGRMQRDPRFDHSLHSVLVSHLYLDGVKLSSGHEVSMKDDVTCPPENLADGWAYVALGHVHKPQALAGRDHVRYCGSLERLRIDEKDDDKGVVLIEIDASGLREAPRVLPLECSSFLDVKVTNPLEELPTLRDRYPDAARALVRFHATYRPGLDDIDAIHRAIDEVFPRCYDRTVIPIVESRPDRASVSSRTGRRGFRETVLDYLTSQLDGNEHAPAVLAAAESLIEEVRP